MAMVKIFCNVNVAVSIDRRLYLVSGGSLDPCMATDVFPEDRVRQAPIKPGFYHCDVEVRNEEEGWVYYFKNVAKLRDPRPLYNLRDAVLGDFTPEFRAELIDGFVREVGQCRDIPNAMTEWLLGIAETLREGDE